MSNFKNLLAVAATGLLLASCGVSGDAAPPTTAPNVSSEVGAEIGIDEAAIAAEREAEEEREAEKAAAAREAEEAAAAEQRAALSEAHSSHHSGGYVAPEPEPEISSGISDEEINDLAFDLIWNSQSASDQEDFCWGWNYDQDMMIDAFLEGAGDSFSRSEVKSFFNGVC